jgi:hypothetical protein
MARVLVSPEKAANCTASGACPKGTSGENNAAHLPHSALWFIGPQATRHPGTTACALGQARQIARSRALPAPIASRAGCTDRLSDGARCAPSRVSWTSSDTELTFIAIDTCVRVRHSATNLKHYVT